MHFLLRDTELINCVVLFVFSFSMENSFVFYISVFFTNAMLYTVLFLHFSRVSFLYNKVAR